jgi:hypothetical protein
MQRTEALWTTTFDSTKNHIEDSTVKILQVLQRSIDLNLRGFQNLRDEANALLATAHQRRTLDHQWLLEQIDKRLERSTVNNQVIYQNAASGTCQCVNDSTALPKS